MHHSVYVKLINSNWKYQIKMESSKTAAILLFCNTSIPLFCQWSVLCHGWNQRLYQRGDRNTSIPLFCKIENIVFIFLIQSSFIIHSKLKPANYPSTWITTIKNPIRMKMMKLKKWANHLKPMSRPNKPQRPIHNQHTIRFKYSWII